MYSYSQNRAAREAGMKRLGLTLRRLRLARDMTQKELSDAAGFRYYTWISQIEIGKGKLASENIRPYAQALGVDPAWLARQIIRAYDPELYRLLCVDKPVTPAGEDPA